MEQRVMGETGWEENGGRERGGGVREGCGRVVGRVELAMMAWLGGAGKVEGRGQGRDEFEFTK